MLATPLGLRSVHTSRTRQEGSQIRTYTAECYRPGLKPEAVGAIVASVRTAADAVNGPGTPIRFLGTIHFVHDEVLFVLFRALRESEVRAVGHLAPLSFDRVAESCVDLSEQATGPQWHRWATTRPRGRRRAS